MEDWLKIRDKVMKEILEAKFSQVDLAKTILLATNDAELWHSPGRTKAERQNILEEVRQIIKTSKKMKLDNPKEEI